MRNKRIPANLSRHWSGTKLQKRGYAPALCPAPTVLVALLLCLNSLAAQSLDKPDTLRILRQQIESVTLHEPNRIPLSACELSNYEQDLLKRPAAERQTQLWKESYELCQKQCKEAERLFGMLDRLLYEKSRRELESQNPHAAMATLERASLYHRFNTDVVQLLGELKLQYLGLDSAATWSAPLIAALPHQAPIQAWGLHLYSHYQEIISKQIQQKLFADALLSLENLKLFADQAQAKFRNTAWEIACNQRIRKGQYADLQAVAQKAYAVGRTKIAELYANKVLDYYEAYHQELEAPLQTEILLANLVDNYNNLKDKSQGDEMLYYGYKVQTIQKRLLALQNERKGVLNTTKSTDILAQNAIDPSDPIAQADPNKPYNAGNANNAFDLSDPNKASDPNKPSDPVNAGNANNAFDPSDPKKAQTAANKPLASPTSPLSPSKSARTEEGPQILNLAHSVEKPAEKPAQKAAPSPKKAPASVAKPTMNAQQSQHYRDLMYNARLQLLRNKLDSAISLLLLASHLETQFRNPFDDDAKGLLLSTRIQIVTRTLNQAHYHLWTGHDAKADSLWQLAQNIVSAYDLGNVLSVQDELYAFTEAKQRERCKDIEKSLEISKIRIKSELRKSPFGCSNFDLARQLLRAAKKTIEQSHCPINQHWIDSVSIAIETRAQFQYLIDEASKLWEYGEYPLWFAAYYKAEHYFRMHHLEQYNWHLLPLEERLENLRRYDVLAELAFYWSAQQSWERCADCIERLNRNKQSNKEIRKLSKICQQQIKDPLKP